jgi:hypothetical protein
MFPVSSRITASINDHFCRGLKLISCITEIPINDKRCQGVVDDGEGGIHFSGRMKAEMNAHRIMRKTTRLNVFSARVTVSCQDHLL